jgi:hypothetical protein
MDRLKILWFNWRCWVNPDMGGAEVFTREVAKRLVEAGHEVTFFASEFDDVKEKSLLMVLGLLELVGDTLFTLKQKNTIESISAWKVMM